MPPQRSKGMASQRRNGMAAQRSKRMPPQCRPSCGGGALRSAQPGCQLAEALPCHRLGPSVGPSPVCKPHSCCPMGSCCLPALLSAGGLQRCSPTRMVPADGDRAPAPPLPPTPPHPPHTLPGTPQVILKWLQDTYECEVVTFTADLGQVSDPPTGPGPPCCLPAWDRLPAAKTCWLVAGAAVGSQTVSRKCWPAGRRQRAKHGARPAQHARRSSSVRGPPLRVCRTRPRLTVLSPRCTPRVGRGAGACPQEG